MSRIVGILAVLACTAFAAPAAPAAPSQSVTEDIRDIRAPVEIPAPTPWDWYVGGALGVAALIAGAILLRRKHVRALSAHQRAFASLEEARALMKPETAREFAMAASNAVRRYLEERFGVPAGRRTTAEFLEAVAGNPPALLRDHLAPLKEFLGFADRAKFGGWVLSAAEFEGMHTCAWNLVETSRAQEEKRKS